MPAPSLEKLRSRLFCGFLTLALGGIGCTVYSDGLRTSSAGADGTAGSSTDFGGGTGPIDVGGGGSSAGDGSPEIAGSGNVSGDDDAGGAGASHVDTGGAAGGSAGKGGLGGSAGNAGHAGAAGAVGSGGHAGALASGGTGGAASSGAGGAPAGGAPAGGAPAGGAPAGGAPAGGAPAGGAPAGGAPAGGAGGGVLCSDHTIPPTSSWVLSASHHQSTSPVANLIDGTSARWSTGKPQAGDEWLQVDFGVAVNLRSINLQQGTIDANDYPRSYVVIVSNTALDSNGTVRASGVGTGGVTTTINLPSVTSGRYLLIKQLGTSLSWWSVEELEVTCSD